MIDPATTQLPSDDQRAREVDDLAEFEAWARANLSGPAQEPEASAPAASEQSEQKRGLSRLWGRLRNREPERAATGEPATASDEQSSQRRDIPAAAEAQPAKKTAVGEKETPQAPDVQQDQPGVGAMQDQSPDRTAAARQVDGAHASRAPIAADGAASRARFRTRTDLDDAVDRARQALARITEAESTAARGDDVHLQRRREMQRTAQPEPARAEPEQELTSEEQEVRRIVAESFPGGIERALGRASTPGTGERPPHLRRPGQGRGPGRDSGRGR